MKRLVGSRAGPRATSVFETYRSSGGRVSSVIRVDEDVTVEGPSFGEGVGHYVTISDRTVGLTTRHYGSRVDLAAWMAFAEGLGRSALDTLDTISSSREILGEAAPIMHHRSANCWAGECHLIYNGHAEEIRVYIPGFYDETLDVRDASPTNFQQVAQLKFGAPPEDWIEGVPFEFGEQAPPEEPEEPEAATDLDPDTMADTSASDVGLPPEDVEASVLIGQTIRFQDEEGNVREGQVVDEDGERLQVRTEKGVEEVIVDQIVGDGIDLTPDEEEEEEPEVDLADLQDQIMGDEDEEEEETESLLQQAELLTSEISRALIGSGSAVARKAGRASAHAGSLPKKRKKKKEDEIEEDFTTGDVPTLDVPLGLIRSPDVQTDCPEGQQFNVLTGKCEEIPEQAKGFRGFRLAMRKTQKTPGMTMTSTGEA